MTLNSLSLSLARHPDVVAFSRNLVQRARGRLGRITTVFSFVSQLVDVPPTAIEEPRDGVDSLLVLAGEAQGPAVILAALLRALGERVHLECAPSMTFVRVELDAVDVARLPPHATLLVTGERCFVPLDPRWSRSPLGFVPHGTRAWLERRALLPRGAAEVRGSLTA